VRDHLAAVYAFARLADDVADEGDLPAVERLARLDEIEEHLLACAADPESAREPLFLALGHTIVSLRLPVEPFRNLLTAFRRDAAGESRRFATFDDVLAYCAYSANPVGRIVLGLFRQLDAERAARSDDVCTALQLTNFLQDVRSDFVTRDRIYLPDEDLGRFPGSRVSIETGRLTPGFRDCLAFEVERTRGFFTRGLTLADMVEGRLRHEVRLFANGGLAILDRIEAADYDVLTHRPSLGRSDLARLLWKELWT
jgi:phytoene synthase